MKNSPFVQRHNRYCLGTLNLLIQTQSRIPHLGFAYELNLLSDTVSICLWISGFSLKSHESVKENCTFIIGFLFSEMRFL